MLKTYPCLLRQIHFEANALDIVGKFKTLIDDCAKDDGEEFFTKMHRVL